MNSTEQIPAGTEVIVNGLVPMDATVARYDPSLRRYLVHYDFKYGMNSNSTHWVEADKVEAVAYCDVCDETLDDDGYCTRVGCEGHA